MTATVAGRCGRERGVDWIGGSPICASTGHLLAGPATPPGGVAAPAVRTAMMDPAAARDKSLGPHNDAFGDRRPDLYGTPAPPGARYSLTSGSSGTFLPVEGARPWQP